MADQKLQTLKYKRIAYKGKVPRIQSIFIAPNCFIIGDVILKEGSSVWFGATIRGDTELCQIGEGTAVMEQCFVENSIIGDNTLVSHGAIVHKCKIGNEVVVGIGARVLNGANIGDNTIIGAGTTILPMTEIPPNSIVIEKGKILRTSTEKDLKYIQESVKEVQEKAKILDATLKDQTS